MNSIFDLNTDGTVIGSTISDFNYEQIAGDRTYNDSNFATGSQYFRWEKDGINWWLPSHSYFRLRFQLGKSADTSLSITDGISPAMGFMSNMYQSGEFLINNKQVNKITDFLPEISALKTRQTKSGPWLNGIGRTINFWNADFTERLDDVTDNSTKSGIYYAIDLLDLGYIAVNTTTIAVDTGILTIEDGATADSLPTGVLLVGDEIEIESAVANVGTLRYRISEVIGEAVDTATYQLDNIQTIAKAAETYTIAPVTIYRKKTLESKDRNVLNIEVLWKPPFSIFDIEHALPSGKYSIKLDVASGSTYKTLSIESTGSATKTTSDFVLTVDSLYFYVATMSGPRVDNMTYYLDLDDIEVLYDPVTQDATQEQKVFTVNKNTRGLTVAFADKTTRTDTRYTPTKFKVQSDKDLNLTQLQISYASQNKPSVREDFEYSDGKDFIQQKYIDSYLNNNLFFDTAGPESFDEWITRGPFYHFDFQKDSTDQSTQAIVRYKFSSGGTSANILLFQHFKTIVKVVIAGGIVRSVNVM